MSNEITTYLKHAHLQIAAEAFYGLKNAQPWTPFDDPITQEMLTTGNTRSSRFTETDATWFSQTWTVDEHISNTTTGFSGTLFRALKADPDRGIVAGELVLSFRSTEFADDAARDNQATNTLEIKKTGWAFGQIMDMEMWFSSLKANGKIGANETFAVTGYSLGGHVASEFNLMYPGDAARTVTFNGAGIGTFNIDETPLKGLVSLFAELSTQDYSEQIGNNELREPYGRLRAAVEEGRHPDQAELAALMGFSSLVYGERVTCKRHRLRRTAGGRRTVIHEGSDWS